MDKDFESWHGLKKKIDAGNENRFYKERQIWWCSLGVNVGSEQDGKDKGFVRPIIVLRGLSRKTCLVVPLTTSANINKNRIKVGVVDGEEASAIVSQIRTIDTKRFLNRIGIVNKTIFESIRKAVRDLL